jgi:rubrerythrin
MTDDQIGPEAAETIALLEECRTREKAQTLFYRRLAARAETGGRAELVERFNDLHADEQHHLSRLTARILELGGEPADPRPEAPAGPDSEDGLEGWEELAREREGEEVGWYESLEGRDTDPRTAELFSEILDSERHHRDRLGGKWMSA